MKKNTWAKYNSGDGIIEIIIRDETGAKIESFIVNQQDKRTQRQIAGILKSKYDIDFSMEEEIFDF